MPAVECKDSAQVANLISTETEEIMNTFMEGESFLVFANAAPTCNLWVERKKSCSLGRGYVVFWLHPGFSNGDIRLTSQVFDIPVSGSPQSTNYPLDRAKMGQHFRLIVSLSSKIKRRRSLLSCIANE